MALPPPYSGGPSYQRKAGAVRAAVRRKRRHTCEYRHCDKEVHVCFPFCWNHARHLQPKERSLVCKSWMRYSCPDAPPLERFQLDDRPQWIKSRSRACIRIAAAMATVATLDVEPG